MGISGVNNSSYNNIYSQLSSGKRINKAADGAADLAIIKKENAVVGGLNVGSENIKDGIGALNIADGAIGQVTDYLQSIQELSVKAANGTLNGDDRKYIQGQIDQYMQGIADIEKTASFNGQGLINGDMSSLDIAADGNGSKINVDMGGSLMKQLGLEGYDVSSGKFDMKVIDNALSTVSKFRSNVGAKTNALTAAYNMNQNAAYNLTSATSKLEDLDIPKAVSEKKKQDTLQQYSLMMQKKRMEQEKEKTRRMFDA